MGIDESRVRNVGADVDDLHLFAGQRQHLVPRSDARHEAAFDQQRLRNGRIVHRHDPTDDDEVTFLRPLTSGVGRCRSILGVARRRCRGIRGNEGAAGDEGEHGEHRRR